MQTHVIMIITRAASWVGATTITFIICTLLSWECNLKGSVGRTNRPEMVWVIPTVLGARFPQHILPLLFHRQQRFFVGHAGKSCCCCCPRRFCSKQLQLFVSDILVLVSLIICFFLQPCIWIVWKQVGLLSNRSDRIPQIYLSISCGIVFVAEQIRFNAQQRKCWREVGFSPFLQLSIHAQPWGHCTT